MGVLHETGHALYEQSLPKEWAHWPLGKARGMAIHESQSLFVEKQVGRSPEFWEWALPHVKTHLGDAALDGLDARRRPAHVHLIKRGLIRVDADEATYPLHVILRFELEQELVDGTLEVADIPEAWDAQDDRVSRPADHRHPAGRPDAGRPLAGRRLRLLPELHARRHDRRAAMGGAREGPSPTRASDMRKGKFDAINDWRRDNIWSQASRWSTPELLERATGEQLNAAALHRPPEAALPELGGRRSRTAAISSAWSASRKSTVSERCRTGVIRTLRLRAALERIEEGVGLARRRKTDAGVVVVDRQVAHRVAAGIDLEGHRRIVAGVRQELVGEAEADLEHAVGAVKTISAGARPTGRAGICCSDWIRTSAATAPRRARGKSRRSRRAARHRRQWRSNSRRCPAR